MRSDSYKWLSCGEEKAAFGSNRLTHGEQFCGVVSVPVPHRLRHAPVSLRGS
uniref:Uncharacterized protein n=1 Tax=Arundo donax TaxID=35708 RepID=A0A0A8ZZ87_ARUDO